MKSEEIVLKGDNFKKIFPFFIRLNSDLKIIDLGPSILKLLGDITEKHLVEVFKFIRPQLSIQMSLDSIKKNLDNVIIMESLDHPIKTRFRGQFIYLANENELIYLNSPWFTDVTDLGIHNLLISDFAIHDTVTDNLQLLQSKQIVNEDMKIIAEELRQQRDELYFSNEKINEIARFPDENPQPIFRLNFEGNLLYANEHAHELINSRAMLDEPFWGTVYLKFEANNFTTFEKEIKLGDRILLATLAPFPEKSYFNVYLRDITETVLFQNELVTTSSRLYSLINNMNSAVLSENENREIILVNQHFCDLFKIPVSPELLIGMDCSNSAEESKQLFENQDEFVTNINAILKSRKPVYGEILKMKDGKMLERDYIPIFENENYIGHIWKYQDITEIARYKESLRTVEDKYRKIMENLNFGLLEVDLDEKITKVFPAFCEMTGYSEKELIGFNARNLLAYTENLEVLDKNKALRKKGASSAYEIKLRTKNGELKWVIVSGVPIYNEENIMTGSMGIHLDITDRKKLEEDLLLANERAYSSVKAKEIFVANMSHEIRTPMNVILGMSDLLTETELNNEQLKYLSAIRNSSKTLLNLINDVLDFSKIEADQMIIEETDLNLKQLVSNFDVAFSPSVREKGISFFINFDDLIDSHLIGDTHKLNQVLINLVSNAIKFTDQGKVNLNIQLVENYPLSQTVKFEITDTGIGISEENLESVFQMFKQEDSSISRKYGGTGIGLSISKSIVEKMNSKIEIKSEKNIGSSFSFILTFKKANVLSNTEITSMKMERTNIGKVKILVAEDNQMNQLLISAILDKEKINYVLVNNGQDVIECLLKDKFDLILMDIQMPIMDGVSATKHIRQILKQEIPIIALTANVSEKDEKTYKKAGMNDYLSKPFKKEDLFKKISELLGYKEQSINKLNSLDIPDSSILYSLKRIQDIADGDEVFVSSIIKTFVKEVPICLDQINMGLVTNDFLMMSRAAHQLKPTIDIFEIDSIKSVIRELENDCSKVENPDLTEIQNKYLFIKNVLNRLIKELENLI